MNIYQYHNHILSLPAYVLYEELGLVCHKTVKRQMRSGVLEKTKDGRGQGSTTFVSWRCLPERFKNAVAEKYGNPEKQGENVWFKDYLKEDLEAVKFFKEYELSNGKFLPEEVQKEYCCNAKILKCCHTMVTQIFAKSKSFGKGAALWEKMAKIIAELGSVDFPHSLPSHPKDLKYKYKALVLGVPCKKYPRTGYEGLIHGNFLNNHAEKVNPAAGLWIVATWSNQIHKTVSTTHLLELYNSRAREEGWRKLSCAKTLRDYLDQPHVKKLWYGHRYGEHKADQKYGYQHKTSLPFKRDALWYSDGTKLNLYFLDETGKLSTCQVYHVMDAYSEVFLGYHISKTEDYEAQYAAYRMAIEYSGHKPYQISFDGQGGHGKLKSGSFMGSISKLAITTKPYNGRSKTIESAFGRFQTQFLKRAHNWTGMNITSKSLESKANLELILENAKNMPTLDELKVQYKEFVDMWNNAPHPKTKVARAEMYKNSSNPETPKVDLLDMVEMFWIQREKPIVCTSAGIRFKEKKRNYEYMVYRPDGLPDFEWLSNNIDRKFVIKFDPQDMDMILLYTETPRGLLRECYATTKKTVSRAKQEQDAFDHQYLKQTADQTKSHRIKTRDEGLAIMEAHGTSPEQQGFNLPRIKGVETSRKSKNKKPAPNGKAKVKPQSYGEYLKEESNMEPTSILRYQDL
ncbi:MAG: kinase [Flavobacteriaceae bacterium]|nr:MAG: kinase [Flavobacteriaceae bacterium]